MHKRGENARVFYWQSPGPLGDEMFRELVQFAVQAYIGRDLVALCDLVFWPDKTIETFYERFEEWKEFCGAEMVNFEADLYLAREQGIQFKTTGGRLEYLDIEINDDTDPQNLLRRILSEELTVYDGKQLLLETAEIKNFCGFVSTNIPPSSTTVEESPLVENGNRVLTKQTSSGLHNVSDIFSDSVSSTQAQTVAHNSIKAQPKAGGYCRCGEQNSRGNFISSKKGYTSLKQIACGNEKRAQSCVIIARPCIAESIGLGRCDYSFQKSNEQEITFANQGGLQNSQNIQMTGITAPTCGDNVRNYPYHKSASFVRNSADFGSKNGRYEKVCTNTQNIFESHSCYGNYGKESSSHLKQSLKATTKLNVCSGDVESSSLENVSDDEFESCEEGSSDGSIGKSTTATSKNSCSDGATLDDNGVLDNAEDDPDDSTNGYNEMVEDKKPSDYLSKPDDDERCKSLKSGSLVRFVLDRLYGFRAIKRSKEKRKMRAIMSSNGNNDVETKEDNGENFKPSKQPRRDDTDSEVEAK